MSIERFQNQRIEMQDISELVYESEPTHFYYDYREHLTEDDIRNAEIYIDAMTYDHNSLDANLDITMAAKYAMLVKMMYPERPIPPIADSKFQDSGDRLDQLGEYDEAEFIRYAIPLCVLYPNSKIAKYGQASDLLPSFIRVSRNSDEVADLGFYAWALGQGKAEKIPAYDLIAEKLKIESEQLKDLKFHSILHDQHPYKMAAIRLFGDETIRGECIHYAKNTVSDVETWLEAGQPHKALHEAFWLSVLTADNISLDSDYRLHLDFGRKEADEKLPTRRSF